MVTLLKYDTAHGRFPGEVTSDGDMIIVNGMRIQLLSERDPEKLPWKALGVDVVIGSTGRFTDKAAAASHIHAGAKKVLITAPATGGVKTIVNGINNELIGDDLIYSTASCTTGCIAPVLSILDKEFGIESGYMVTVHAFTADQNLQDAPHKDLRRARAASYSIIPTTTGAAKASKYMYMGSPQNLNFIQSMNKYLEIFKSNFSIITLTCYAFGYAYLGLYYYQFDIPIFHYVNFSDILFTTINFLILLLLAYLIIEFVLFFVGTLLNTSIFKLFIERKILKKTWEQ
jgi:hypothetical protein